MYLVTQASPHTLLLRPPPSWPCPLAAPADAPRKPKTGPAASKGRRPPTPQPSALHYYYAQAPTLPSLTFCRVLPCPSPSLLYLLYDTPIPYSPRIKSIQSRTPSSSCAASAGEHSLWPILPACRFRPALSSSPVQMKSVKRVALAGQSLLAAWVNNCNQSDLRLWL